LKHLDLSDADEVLEQMTALQSASEKMYSPSYVNPNIYSASRWRWIWTINRTVHRNRLTKLLREMTNLRNKKRLQADIAAAESDRRRQVAYSKQQQQESHRISLSEINNIARATCPSFAKRPDFRKYALKNLMHSEPVFKVSIAEIYQSTSVRPVSFDPKVGPRKYSKYGKVPEGQSERLSKIKSGCYRIKQEDNKKQDDQTRVRRESCIEKFKKSCEAEIRNENYYYDNSKLCQNYF